MPTGATGFGVPNIGVFAGCFADGAVKGPGYNAAPGEDGERDEGQGGADADEDCSLGKVGFLHERCVGGRRDARGWVIIAGEFWETGLQATEVSAGAGEGGEGFAIGGGCCGG